MGFKLFFGVTGLRKIKGNLADLDSEVAQSSHLEPGARLGNIMAFHRLGFFMRTQIMVYGALLSLGFTITAWATPLALPVPPAQEKEMPFMNEPLREPVAPPVPPRGQMLYENHCMSCHESVVHIRGNHRTQSLTELRGRVSHWADYLRLRWGMDEIEEVTAYLNDHCYKFESR